MFSEINGTVNKSFLKQITQSAENYSSRALFSLLSGDKTGSSQLSGTSSNTLLLKNNFGRIKSKKEKELILRKLFPL